MRRTFTRLAVAALVTVTLARPVLAHAGSLGGSLRSVAAPFWLIVVTGGGVVGVSFLFTSLMTDHDLIRSLNAHRVRLSSGVTDRLTRGRLLGWVAVVLLVVVLAVALFGPSSGDVNLAVLVVWVGWWAGYTMSVYLVGNSWPWLNPWRRLAQALPPGERTLPATLGSWPSVVGLLALVWLEVVSPVAQRPQTLAVVVIAYSLVTVVGAAAFGEAWFERVDPVSRVFSVYGRLAPVQRTEDGLTLSVPGTALARNRTPMDADDAAFVVALLWVTTFDGLVSTAPWNDLVASLATSGVPPRLFLLVAVCGGFGLFLGGYRLATRLARRTADTYVTAGFIEGWFAPALLPIAAGYHVAHFLGYFLSLAPTLVAVALDPLSTPTTVPVLVLPSWYGSVQLGFVVLGHLLAIWVAHARSFELFPGRLQPIRSQYPFVVLMVGYTMTSMWVVAQPYTQPIT